MARYRIGLLLCGFALSLVLSACGGKREPPPVEVGFISPAASLDLAAVSHARQGVELAIEEANTEPGRRIAALWPEIGNQPPLIRAATTRLITVNHVAALLGSGDPAQVDAIISGLNTVAEAAKVPLVANGGGRDGAAEPFVFHLGVSPADQGRLLARFAAREFTGKKLAMLVHRGPEGSSVYESLAEAFAAECAKNGNPVSRTWSFASRADLKDVTQQVSKAKPAALFVAGNGTDIVGLQAEGLSDNVPFIIGGSDGSLTALRACPIANPVYGVTAFLADAPNPNIQAFVERYQKRFHEPPDVFAALAYDSARFLCQGIRALPGEDMTKLRTALAEIKQFTSVTGTFPMTKEHWLSRGLFLVEIADGNAKTIATLDPSSLQAVAP